MLELLSHHLGCILRGNVSWQGDSSKTDIALVIIAPIFLLTVKNKQTKNNNKRNALY